MVRQIIALDEEIGVARAAEPHLLGQTQVDREVGGQCVRHLDVVSAPHARPELGFGRVVTRCADRPAPPNWMIANFCPRLLGVVLGMSCARVREFRARTGRAATCSATTTEDGCDLATSTSSVSAATVSGILQARLVAEFPPSAARVMRSAEWLSLVIIMD